MKQNKRSHGLIIGSFLILASAAFLYFFCVPQFSLGLESKSWPSVVGKVTEKKIVRKLDRKDKKYSYRPKVLYEYEVDGSRYEGDLLFFGSKNYTSKDRIKVANTMIGILKGHDVKVYYNPNRPDISVLKNGPAFQVIVTTVVTGLFMLLGVVVFFIALLKR